MTDGARSLAGTLLGIAIGAAFCLAVVQIESGPIRLACSGAGLGAGLAFLAWLLWRGERAANPAARLTGRHVAKLAGVALLGVLAPLAGHLALAVLGLETPEERMIRIEAERYDREVAGPENERLRRVREAVAFDPEKMRQVFERVAPIDSTASVSSR